MGTLVLNQYTQQQTMWISFQRIKLDDKNYLTNVLSSVESVWRAWIRLKAKFPQECDEFLNLGRIDFGNEFRDFMAPLAGQVVRKNGGWQDENDLVDVARNVLLLRKVVSMFQCILEPDEIETPRNKQDLLRLFHILRQKIVHRQTVNVDADEKKIIDTILTKFLPQTFTHDPSSVQAYVEFGLPDPNALKEFLLFCNPKYWQTRDFTTRPATCFHLIGTGKGKNAETDPLPSYWKRLQFFSKVWHEQIMLLRGGENFIEFVENEDWEIARSLLKVRREPKGEVRGWETRKHHSDEPTVVPMSTQIHRIRKWSGNILKGPHAKVFNTLKHGNVVEIIGKAAKGEAQKTLRAQSEMAHMMRHPPPPVADLSQPPLLSEVMTQVTEVPITQTAAPARSDDIKLDFAPVIESELCEKIASFGKRWAAWTLIEESMYDEVNELGCTMLTSAFRVFLQAIVEEVGEERPRRVLEWVEHLNEMDEFRISRAVVLCLANVFRFTKRPKRKNAPRNVVDVETLLDQASAMSLWFFWEVVLDVGTALGIDARARWFWRILTRILGKKHSTRLIALNNNLPPANQLPMESSNWAGFAQISSSRPESMSESTQMVIDCIKEDGLWRTFFALCRTCLCVFSVYPMAIVFLSSGTSTRRSRGWQRRMGERTASPKSFFQT